jgi:hypothetical protein
MNGGFFVDAALSGGRSEDRASENAICFLHAADLRPDAPFSGGPGLEDVLFRLRDIPWEALGRLVDYAIAEKVDFAVLSGVLHDPSLCSVRTRFLLLEQFDRLAGAQISCYVEEQERVFLFGAGETEKPEEATKIDRPCFSFVRPIDELPAAFPVLSTALKEELASSPGPLQGRGLNEAGPHGAWRVTLKGDGTLERQFVELDALRLETWEEKIDFETEDAAAAFLVSLKERFRALGRPLALRLKIVGKFPPDRELAEEKEGESSLKNVEKWIKFFNEDEALKKNFVILDWIDWTETELSKEAISSADGDLPEGGSDDLLSDFRGEISFFTSKIDSRLALYDVLKEKGLLKRVLADEGTAPLLEEMTEADMDKILRNACGRLSREISEE